MQVETNVYSKLTQIYKTRQKMIKYRKKYSDLSNTNLIYIERPVFKKKSKICITFR